MARNASGIDEIMQQDMTRVEHLLYEQTGSETALIKELGRYVIGSGGKRVRSLIVCLTARALGYDGPHHTMVSAILELIHSASLMHDDVVDGATRRRGRASANSVFGNIASVRVGNFLCTQAFRMMVALPDRRIAEVMTCAANVMTEGEIYQLSAIANVSLLETEYFKIIYCKTGRLFEVAAQCAAIVAGAGQEEEAALSAYGMHLGTAFQLADDALDYAGDNTMMGKSAGQDWEEAKVTLPLIHAMANTTSSRLAFIRAALKGPDRRHSFGTVLSAIRDAGSLDYTRRRAEEEAESATRALECLPASQFRTALEDIARKAPYRKA